MDRAVAICVKENDFRSPDRLVDDNTKEVVLFLENTLHSTPKEVLVRYSNVFIEEGYDSLEAISLMEVEDLEALGIKRGHRKLLLKAAKSVLGEEYNVRTINESVGRKRLDKDSNHAFSLDIGDAYPEKGPINHSATCDDEENSGGTGPGNTPLPPPPIFSTNSDLGLSSSRHSARAVAQKRTLLRCTFKTLFSVAYSILSNHCFACQSTVSIAIISSVCSCKY